MPFPIPRPISGNRFAPKIMMMMIRMITSSGKPKLPIGRAPWKFRGELADCITLNRRAAWRAAAALAVLLGGATGGASQFTSGVNLVEVYASVTDQHGNPVTGLSQGDFELREDGVLQAISNFAAGDFPLAAAVAIDRSFSVAGTKLTLAKAAAQAFLAELRPADDAMVLAVGSQVEVVAPLSTDRGAQRDAINRLDAFGTTGLHDAIIRAIDDVQPAKGRRALIVLSDGSDRYSQASAADALERARRSDVMIFPVAIGATRPPLFAELATLTGGRSFHSRDGAALAETLRSIAHELRRQYLVGYTPRRPPVAGSNEWRTIAVSVKRPGAIVRARDGYLVK
jgi:Ca-activated chloride channel family protein